MALSDIVGVNAAARRSKYLSGKIKARMTTLVPAKAGDNMGIAIEKDKRIKSRKVPQRKVGETFAFLESIIESEAPTRTMLLYSTQEPSTAEQEVVFNYARFADVEAYGLKSGKTRLDDGGLFVGTKGQSMVVSYGTSAPPSMPRAARPSARPAVPASAPALPPGPEQQYDPVPELPFDFATSFGNYRVFFYKDEHWKSGRVVQFVLNTGRTASCTLCVMVYVEIGKDRLETRVAAPYIMMETSFRVIHTAYHGSCVLDAGSNGRWFLRKKASITLPVDRSKKTNKRLDSAKFKKNRIVRDKQAALIFEDEASEVADDKDVEEAPDLVDDGDDESFSESEEGEEGKEEGEEGADNIDDMDGDGMEAEAREGKLGGGYTSIEERACTGGIVQAIVDTVTACQLLAPPRFHMYSNSVASTSYGRLSWPGLSWSQVNSFRLMRFPDLTVGGASDIPVNRCLKNLSMAAVLGRLPTCAYGCTLLTPHELRDTLPLSLTSLACIPGLRKGREVIQGWPLTRAEIVCKAADVGVNENNYTATCINGINCSTLYLFHTAKYLNTTADKQHLAYYFKSLHGQQATYQQYWRGKLAEEQSAIINKNTKMYKGRTVNTDDGSAVYGEMINIMLRGTWGPFETHITNWLEANNMSIADLDKLSDMLQKEPEWGTAKRNPPSDTDAAHLTQVPWVLELAQHLLDNHANLYDCFNLETLAHLIAYIETPVRQQDVWENRASLVHAKVIKYVVLEGGVNVTKVGGVRLFLTIDDPTNKKTAGRTKGRTGHLNDPLPTTIPLPPGLTRMYLVVLFMCRSMRMLWQQTQPETDTPVPDRIIGLAGSSNKVLGSKTFTEVIRKLGMCHFAVPKWGPYSIRNDFVTAIFRQAYSAHHTGGGHGAAQELLVSRMNDIHSSLDAAISNYNQWVRNAHTSFLRPPKSSNVNNGGRYGGGGDGSMTDTYDNTGADVGGDTYRVRRGGGSVDPTVAALLVQLKEQNEHHSKQLHQVLGALTERRRARNDSDSGVEEVAPTAKRVQGVQVTSPLVHTQSVMVPPHAMAAAQYMFHMHAQFQHLSQQVAYQQQLLLAHGLQHFPQRGYPMHQPVSPQMYMQPAAHVPAPNTLPASVRNALPGWYFTGPRNMAFDPRP
ncbi:hypothetical protein JKP88DRAFT_265487 [Tribonema minus]|uniref:Uncharacterized protein n=1 Tax=Tribonema minus TaxID=303371 RepID=A0A835YS90_9STRA|nr:hypothetical protein JKP88DRAFT_265487 [Tribonema minus]